MESASERQDDEREGKEIEYTAALMRPSSRTQPSPLSPHWTPSRRRKTWEVYFVVVHVLAALIGEGR